MNDKNLEFYERVGIEPLKDLAKAGGFSNYRDLELIYSRIKDSGMILEVGAAYGRCIDYLLLKKFPGQIIGLEQNQTYVKHLRNKYGAGSQVQVVEGDLKKIDLPQGIDTALWMWSGIIDFSKEQQLECLQKLFAVLNPGGQVIMDVPRSGVAPDTVRFPVQNIPELHDEKSVCLDTPYGVLCCYIPGRSDMEGYRKACGFTGMDVIEYDTDTDKKRTIFILIK